MKNMETVEFCNKFNPPEEIKVCALKYKTMKEFYDTLLEMKEGYHNSRQWALWVITQNGVVEASIVNKLEKLSDYRVAPFMKYNISTQSFELVEKYENGVKVDSKNQKVCNGLLAVLVEFGCIRAFNDQFFYLIEVGNIFKD